MSAQENKRFTIHFQPEPWLKELLDREKGIHKTDSNTDIIHKLMKELLSLREHNQRLVTAISQRQAAPEPEIQSQDLPESLKIFGYEHPSIKAYYAERGRTTAILERLEQAEGIKTKAAAEREREKTDQQQKRLGAKWEHEYELSKLRQLRKGDSSRKTGSNIDMRDSAEIPDSACY